MSEQGLAWRMLLAGIALTYVWRALGVLFATRIDPQGTAFRWVGCVAHAMLAGLIARMLLLPVGVLEDTTMLHRLAALAVAFAVFFVAGRRLLLSVSAGVLAFMALVAWA